MIDRVMFAREGSVPLFCILLDSYVMFMIFIFARLRMHSLFHIRHPPVEIPSVALGPQLLLLTFSLIEHFYFLFTLCCA
jgi:hypothetical protein